VTLGVAGNSYFNPFSWGWAAFISGSSTMPRDGWETARGDRSAESGSTAMARATSYRGVTGYDVSDPKGGGAAGCTAGS